MRISDWSSDVCSSDLPGDKLRDHRIIVRRDHVALTIAAVDPHMLHALRQREDVERTRRRHEHLGRILGIEPALDGVAANRDPSLGRSEEHTSELQSLMRNSYAVFCLKKKKKQNRTNTTKKSY